MDPLIPVSFQQWLVYLRVLDFEAFGQTEAKGLWIGSELSPSRHESPLGLPACPLSLPAWQNSQMREGMNFADRRHQSS
jgi:hypothetical protein